MLLEHIYGEKDIWMLNSQIFQIKDSVLKVSPLAMFQEVLIMVSSPKSIDRLSYKPNP